MKRKEEEKNEKKRRGEEWKEKKRRGMKRKEEEKNEKKRNLEIDLTSSFNLIEWNKSTRINSRNSWTTFFD